LLGDIPSPRSNFSLSKFAPRKVFLYGGCDDKNDLNDSYVLDLGNFNDEYTFPNHQ